MYSLDILLSLFGTSLLFHVQFYMDCSLPGFSGSWDSPDKNTGVGCHALFRQIFPTQGSNLGLLHCRQILYL